MQFEIDLKRATKKVRHRFGGHILRGTLWSARFIPYPYGSVFWAGLGKLVYRLLSKEKKLIKKHLEIALSNVATNADLDRIAKDCISHLGLSLYELANTDYILKRKDKFLVFRNQNKMDEALAERKGLIVITGHVGNWELMAQVFASLGYPVNVIAKKLTDKKINEIVVSFRMAGGVRSIYRGDKNVSRQIISSLRKNEILGMLIDQDINVQGVWVDFFGVPAYTPIGAAQLAIKTGCPVVACFIRRLGGGRHLITVSDPIEITKTGDIDHDITVNTQNFTRIIEDTIRLAPEQWVWWHKRWKTRKND